MSCQSVKYDNANLYSNSYTLDYSHSENMSSSIENSLHLHSKSNIKQSNVNCIQYEVCSNRIDWNDNCLNVEAPCFRCGRIYKNDNFNTLFQQVFVPDTKKRRV